MKMVQWVKHVLSKLGDVSSFPSQWKDRTESHWLPSVLHVDATAHMQPAPHPP